MSGSPPYRYIPGPYIPKTFVPKSYKGYDPGFNFPAPTPTFSPTGYPLNPVTTCDPEDFGPHPVPFEIPESYKYVHQAPSYPPGVGTPPPPGFVYQPHHLSYSAGEPTDSYTGLEHVETKEEDEEKEPDETIEKKDIIEPIRWVPSSSSSCQISGALLVGHDIDGSAIYAGRAYHNGDIVPCKVIPSKMVSYIAYGGEEIVKEQFEMMVQNTLSWQWCSNGNVPPGAVQVGNTSDGENLYLGRVNVDGAITPGKIQTSHGCCYYPFDGTERSATEYEVLVSQ